MPRIRYQLDNPAKVRRQYKPRPGTMQKLAWIRDTTGMSPDRFMRTLVHEKFSIAAIAQKLEIGVCTTRVLMAYWGIEPCMKPEVLSTPPKSVRITQGRRESKTGLFMVGERPLIEIMEELGHPGGSPVYKRVRRRLGIGWSFEEALDDALRGPRPGGPASALRPCVS